MVEKWIRSGAKKAAAPPYKKLALPYVLAGLKDNENYARAQSVEYLLKSQKDLVIPKYGHVCPAGLLSSYSDKVKEWLASGGEKKAAPKFPDFDLEKAKMEFSQGVANLAKKASRDLNKVSPQEKVKEK